MLLTVKGKDLSALGVLDQAHNVSVTRRVNELWTASFTLPITDEKNALCSHMNFVDIRGDSGRYYGLYRIMPTETRKSVDAERITYECEHVLATLIDDVIDGLLPALINQPTAVQIQRILNLQTTERWVLGTCDFTRYFQYAFENENGLLAPILSIPQPFDEQYEFTFDTENYPWTLNLVQADAAVKSEVRWTKDMISFEEVSDPTEIVNYIIPKGAGEGVNQLNIADVNGGLRYLKDDESIAEWGRRPYIWIDRRFKDADSLKASAQSLLTQWKEPSISLNIESVDLSVLPEYAGTKRILNGVTRIVVEDKIYYGRILEESIADLSQEHEVDYVISNKLDDIATIQADVERKQRVNEAYSQGATNIMAFGYQDNASSAIAAKIPFYIDDDVFVVNTCELTFRTTNFRTYGTATLGGGQITESTAGGGGIVKSTGSGGSVINSTSSGGGTTKSTTNGGSSTQTSSSGGGTSTSTQSGGGTSETTSDQSFGLLAESTEISGAPNYDGHTHQVNISGDHFNHSHSITIPSHSHAFSTPNHTHSVSIPAHNHSVTIPDHSHQVNIPSHTHEIDLPDHTHSITLPDHTHAIEHGIFTLSQTPTSVQIDVDGNIVNFTGTSGDRIDLIEYMDKGTDGKVTRGRHVVSIKPDDLARIEADLILRVFIQSQLGGSY